MAEKKEERPVVKVETPGLLDQAIDTVRLAWNLWRDRRVGALTKLIPLSGFLYVLSPLDFLPDAIPGIGQLDDTAVIIGSVVLFNMACARAYPEVFLEVQKRLGLVKEEEKEEKRDNPGPDVVEGRFRVV